MMDCLIAAVAIRNSAVLVHQDQDFSVIAEYSDLQVA
jgi:predicted nucleic acid-binding protein